MDKIANWIQATPESESSQTRFESWKELDNLKSKMRGIFKIKLQSQRTKRTGEVAKKVETNFSTFFFQKKNSWYPLIRQHLNFKAIIWILLPELYVPPQSFYLRVLTTHAC